MKMKPSEYPNHATAGSEANIHQASFIERRLFHLTRYCIRALVEAVVLAYIFQPVNLDVYARGSNGKLCYKGTR